MKRHEFDPISFVCGAVLLALGTMFLAVDWPVDVFTGFSQVARWIWPALLVISGAAVLIPAVSRIGRTGEEGDGDAAR
ncbi:MAG: hypothetical protein DIU67_004520 [Actinomycetes bacterium]|jgi:hypothetical protein|nr:MAG: hypothetical protein DIU67_06135 [Actinomycetota bacterium]